MYIRGKSEVHQKYIRGTLGVHQRHIKGTSEEAKRRKGKSTLSETQRPTASADTANEDGEEERQQTTRVCPVRRRTKWRRNRKAGRKRGGTKPTSRNTCEATGERSQPSSNISRIENEKNHSTNNREQDHESQPGCRSLPTLPFVLKSVPLPPQERLS